MSTNWSGSSNRTPLKDFQEMHRRIKAGEIGMLRPGLPFDLFLSRGDYRFAADNFPGELESLMNDPEIRVLLDSESAKDWEERQRKKAKP